jgi:inner membrane protein
MCLVFPSVSGTRTCWDIVVFSHSLVFAFVLSWIVSFVAFPRLPERWTRFQLFSYFFIVTASHGVLDAMTNGRLGIAFFAPFDDTRYFFRSGLLRVTHQKHGPA